jgi:hypothetical protein
MKKHCRAGHQGTRQPIRSVLFTLLAAIACTAGAAPARAVCSPDSVQVGPTCVDKYEASIWQIPASNTTLIRKVQLGKATLAELSAGAIQLGCIAAAGQTAYPASFPVNGNWTAPVYAASVPGVLPSTCVSWFQAEQACALSSKRLVTNQEWQRAAAGTPDDGSTCNTNNGMAPLPSSTGSSSGCVSNWGAFDMVGNVWEYVGDWQEQATSQLNWPSGNFADDFSAVGGNGLGRPGAVVRGGFWHMSSGAGIFAIDALHDPSEAPPAVGFRCAR